MIRLQPSSKKMRTYDEAIERQMNNLLKIEKSQLVYENVINRWNDGQEFLTNDASYRLLDLIDDRKMIIDILQSLMGQAISVEPLFKLMQTDLSMSLAVHNRIYSEDDQRLFRIKGVGIDIVRRVPRNALGYWTKVSLGWITLYETAHQPEMDFVNRNYDYGARGNLPLPKHGGLKEQIADGGKSKMQLRPRVDGRVVSFSDYPLVQVDKFTYSEDRHELCNAHDEHGQHDDPKGMHRYVSEDIVMVDTYTHVSGKLRGLK